MCSYYGFAAFIAGDGEEGIVVFLGENAGVAEFSLAGDAGDSFARIFLEGDELVDCGGGEPGLVGDSEETGVGV